MSGLRLFGRISVHVDASPSFIEVEVSSALRSAPINTLVIDACRSAGFAVERVVTEGHVTAGSTKLGRRRMKQYLKHHVAAITSLGISDVTVLSAGAKSKMKIGRLCWFCHTEEGKSSSTTGTVDKHQKSVCVCVCDSMYMRVSCM